MAAQDSTATKPYGYIYCAEHLESGRVYIGLTTSSIEKRWRGHQYAAALGLRFGRAITKYGASAFKVYELDRAESKEELDVMEIFYIGIYGSRMRGNGFNIAMGGSSGSVSDETRRKLSQVKMGHAVSAETRRKISASQIGRRPTDATRAKLSAVKIGKKHTPERIAKVAAANTGKKHTAETNLKNSINQKKLWSDPERRARMRKVLNEGAAKPENRANVSAAVTSQWADPEKRARLLASRAEAWADPVRKAERLRKRRENRARKLEQQP